MLNDNCVECKCSTAPGSGRWVGRLDSGQGWICVACFYPELCDMCGVDTPMDDEFVCANCYEGEE